MAVCHTLTNSTSSGKLYGKLSLGNIEGIGFLIIDDFRNLRYFQKSFLLLHICKRK